MNSGVINRASAANLRTPGRLRWFFAKRLKTYRALGYTLAEAQALYSTARLGDPGL
jgi:hypothetical protein